MNRVSFGNWGATLSNEDFALAVLGVGIDSVKIDAPVVSGGAEEEGRIISWSLSRFPAKSPTREALRRLIEVGRKALGPGLRVEIARTPDGVDRLHLWEAFSGVVMLEAGRRSLLDCGSVYIREESPTGDLGWQWPLRVGTLDTSALPEFESEWRDDVARHPSGGWVGKLLRRTAMGADRPECDILVLPATTQEAMQRLVASASLYAADLVLILAPMSELPPGVLRWMKTMLTLVRCSAVAILPTRSVYGAFRLMAEALSHNLPLDRALFSAAVQSNGRAPLIIGSRALMLRSALRRRGEALAEKLKEVDAFESIYRSYQTGRMEAGCLSFPGGDQPLILTGGGPSPGGEPMMTGGRGPALGGGMEMASERAVALNLPQGGIARMRMSIPDEDAVLASIFSEKLHRTMELPDMFKNESDMASVLAEVEEAGREAGVNTAMPRFLQARLFAGSRPPAQRADLALKYFRAGSPHGIDVHIGPITQDMSLMRLDAEFPDHELPQNLDEYRLDVDFAPLSTIEAAQRATLVLPRQGPSPECQFIFRVPADADRFEARIIVSYRNRVLQTARLGGATTRLSSPTSEDEIALRPECIARRRFSGLQGPTSFSTAFVFNETGEGAPGITRLNDHGVWVRTDDGLPELAAMFDRFFNGLATRPDDYATSMSEASVNLLRKMAIDGYLLYDKLVLEDLDQTLRSPQRAIQVFTKTQNGRIPVEFVYESEKSPDLDAALCPDWRQCMEDRLCKNAATRTHFCPARFWGLSRVIERHTYDPRLARELKPDFLLTAEPVENRAKLTVLQRVLFGASGRVDNVLGSTDGVASVMQEAAKSTGGNASYADSWTQWRQQVSEQTDSLLMIVHTEPATQGSEIRTLEIGNDASLHTGQVDEEIVGRGAGHHPLVLLLGCHTGKSEIPFEALTSRFKQKQAAIVIGSGSLVHVKHAVPFMKLFMRRLREVIDSDAEQSFGEFMRRLRVECVKEGLLVALALTAYGDADWILSKPSATRSTPNPLPL